MEAESLFLFKKSSEQVIRLAYWFSASVPKIHNLNRLMGTIDIVDKFIKTSDNKAAVLIRSRD